MEAITTTDRRNFQVKRSMFRMAALIQHIQRRFMACEDRHQRRVLRMVLPKMRTEPALPSVYRLHRRPPRFLTQSDDRETPLPRRRELTKLYGDSHYL